LNNDENIILLNTKRLGRCHNYNHSINNNNDNPIPPHFNYEKQLCKDIDLVSERSRDKEGEQVKDHHFFLRIVAVVKTTTKNRMSLIIMMMKTQIKKVKKNRKSKLGK
jgi:hypothetical protein